MATLYILYSDRLNKYYDGACSNLERRLYEHTIGHSKFTSTGIPWVLAYEEILDDLPSAKRRESQIKRMTSRKYIENLIGTALASPVLFAFLEK